MVFDLGEEGMRFNPPRSELITHFDKLLSDMRLTTDEVNRITNQPDFQHHIHGLMTDTAPRFKTIILGSHKYEKIKQ
jgi:hypothetical protein